MKRFLSAFIFAVVLLSMSVLVSCKEKIVDVPAEGELIAGNDIVDVYFSYPSDFVLDKNSSMISVYKTDDDALSTDIQSGGSGYGIITHPNLSVTVFGLPAEGMPDIETYWQNACLPLLEAAFTELETSDGTDLEIAGSLAKRYDYTAKIAGLTFKYAQVIIFRKGSAYTITYTSTESKFDKYINVLDTAVRTLNFK